MPHDSFASLGQPLHVSNSDNESADGRICYSDKEQQPLQQQSHDQQRQRRQKSKKSGGSSSLVSRIRNTLMGRKTTTDQSPRLIYMNNPERNSQEKFIGNRVSTAKYNIITFLPIFLYVEFSKAANLFFLFISCIQVCSSSSLFILLLTFDPA